MSRGRAAGAHKTACAGKAAGRVRAAYASKSAAVGKAAGAGAPRAVADFVIDDQGRIDFELVRMDRKTLGIHIEDDGQVLVKAPRHLKRDQIAAMVLSKAGWIREKAGDAARINALKIVHRFAQGEPFLYLGKSYPLHIQYDANVRRVCVSLSAGRFLIQTPVVDQKTMEAAVLLWYRENALKLVRQRAEFYGPVLGEMPEKILIREQKSRWGSCNIRRELRLNWKLIMAPPKILDYVVVHELCHLKEMNHSARFWSLVEGLCPEYKECRKWLKDYGALLTFEVAARK